MPTISAKCTRDKGSVRVSGPRGRTRAAASRVCGITPSSAAHIRTAMSVTCAPLARMEVKASAGCARTRGQSERGCGRGVAAIWAGSQQLLWRVFPRGENRLRKPPKFGLVRASKRDMLPRMGKRELRGCEVAAPWQRIGLSSVSLRAAGKYAAF